MYISKKWNALKTHIQAMGYKKTALLIYLKILSRCVSKKNISTQTEEVVNNYFFESLPLNVFVVKNKTLPPRVTVITDSVGSGSFFGGVATAIIFAAQVAQSRGYRLRVVTRHKAESLKNVGRLLELNGIRLTYELECVSSSIFNKKTYIDIFEDELFITTSWWTTRAAMQSIAHKNIVYLLQEDERMFYAHSDMQLRCEQTLKSDSIQYVVNTQLLFDYLVSHGLPHLERVGRWFEPAFPGRNRSQSLTSEKYKLMFYARPNHPRNLFYFGLSILNQAVIQGVIDPAHWEIHFIGSNIPRNMVVAGIVPHVHEQLSWADYSALISSIDLGLSLMYTPHPSYPPLDLAAAGAVAVTNRYANKTDLTRYSNNIICGDLTEHSMLVALREGVQLAKDKKMREENLKSCRLQKDWHASMANVVAYYARKQ